MTISITRPIVPVLLLGLLAIPCEVAAQESPHWSEKGCPACHVESAPQHGTLNLNVADAETLCEGCHAGRGDAKSCRHSSGIPVGTVQVDESLASSLKDGKVVCSTCHDAFYQCERPKAHFRFQNSGFLRDRTSHDSGDYCFKCHAQKSYQKLSPHGGVAGTPARPTCRLCHEDMPNTNETGGLNISFNMQHDLNDTCRGCHDTRPHPQTMTFGSAPQGDGWIHLAIPSAEVLENLAAFKKEVGIELPLSPVDGSVSCATCHNPHDFKVGGEHGSESADIKHRLRIANVCRACHEK